MRVVRGMVLLRALSDLREEEERVGFREILRVVGAQELRERS